MIHYVYVPFKIEDLTDKQAALIEEWVQITSAQGKKMGICYAGQTQLDKLPAKASIYILIPGKPEKPLTKLFQGVKSETLLSSPLFSLQFKTSGGGKNMVIPQIAQQMIQDGLFKSSHAHIHIQLCCFTASASDARFWVNAFMDELKKENESQNKKIRLDIYPCSLTKTQTTTQQVNLPDFIAKMPRNKQSLYSKHPQLSLELVSSTIDEYWNYKSSRGCGLSGLLGLNGFFTSHASNLTIDLLKNDKLSPEERFSYAARFLAQNQGTALAEYLDPIITKARAEYEADGIKPDSVTPSNLTF